MKRSIFSIPAVQFFLWHMSFFVRRNIVLHTFISLLPLGKLDYFQFLFASFDAKIENIFIFAAIYFTLHILHILSKRTKGFSELSRSENYLLKSKDKTDSIETTTIE